MLARIFDIAVIDFQRAINTGDIELIHNTWRYLPPEVKGYFAGSPIQVTGINNEPETRLIDVYEMLEIVQCLSAKLPRAASEILTHNDEFFNYFVGGVMTAIMTFLCPDTGETKRILEQQQLSDDTLIENFQAVLSGHDYQLLEMVWIRGIQNNARMRHVIQALDAEKKADLFQKVLSCCESKDIEQTKDLIRDFAAMIPNDQLDQYLNVAYQLGERFGYLATNQKRIAMLSIARGYQHIKTNEDVPPPSVTHGQKRKAKTPIDQERPNKRRCGEILSQSISRLFAQVKAMKEHNTLDLNNPPGEIQILCRLGYESKLRDLLSEHKDNTLEDDSKRSEARQNPQNPQNPSRLHQPTTTFLNTHKDRTPRGQQSNRDIVEPPAPTPGCGNSN